jgi:hypothetical protein
LSLLAVTTLGEIIWEASHSEIIVSVEIIGEKVKFTDFRRHIFYLDKHGSIAAVA